MGLGVLTLSELKDEVRHNLGNRTDLDTRLTRFLNLAQQRIARVKDFEELRQITNNTFVITANPTTDKKISFTNLREIYSFRVLADSESVKLRQVSIRQWDKAIPKPEYYSRGTPSHYTIWKRVAELWKVPSQAYPYEVRWTAWPTAFSDSLLTATSDYLNKDELLIALATGIAFDSLSKDDEADRKYKLAGQLFLESLSMESLEPDLEFAPTREIFKGDFTSGDYWRNPFIMGVDG